MKTGPARPFTVAIDHHDIDDLKTRLINARLPEREALAHDTRSDWDQGVPLATMKQFLDHWRDNYDWRQCEEKLNQYPQFLMDVDGLDIHFLHVRSPHKNARPLLLTHGWPGSILEFIDVISPLTRPEKHGGAAQDAYHLVIPSLPGYGFSGKPDTAGWNIERIATAWDALMRSLGYGRYFAQGGDWGSVVTIEMGVQNLGGLAAFHSNMVLAPPDAATMATATEAEKSALARLKWYGDYDNGYAQIQSTRPQTLGYALADSPTGQMAWILEKFRNWSDVGDDIGKAFSMDQLLDTISLYWFTNSGASSARLYWHSFGKGTMDPVAVPMGGSIFPKELFQTSRRWAEKRYANIIYWNVLDKGGHFAAFEQPEVFVHELRSCFANASL